MSLSKERDEAAEKIRRELQRLIRVSGETQRSLEDKNEFTRGYLSQVLQGHITLTMRHVLGILMALGTPPARFFWQVFEEPDSRTAETYSEMEEIRERLARYEAALEQLSSKGLLDLQPPAEETEGR